MAATSATYHGGSAPGRGGGAYGAGASASIETAWLGPEAFAFDPPARDVADRVELVLPTFGHHNAIELPVITGGGVNLSAMYLLPDRWDGQIVYARCLYTSASAADAAVVPDLRLRASVLLDGATLDTGAGVVGANITTTCPAAAWDLRISDAVAVSAAIAPPLVPAALWMYNWCWIDARTQPLYILGVRLTYGLA